MAVIVGIDPSLAGFAIASAAGAGEVEIVELASKAQGSILAQRFARYRELVDSVLDHVDGAELVLIEGYAYSAKGSVISLAEFGALLRDELIAGSGRVLEVAPSQLKKFATGKGNASKDLVVSALTKRYGRIFPTNNQADAFALLQIGLAITGDAPAQNKVQQETVDQIRGTG